MLPVETVYFSSGTYFSANLSAAARQNSSFFNWKIFFSQSFIPASGNEIFCLLEKVLFYSEFFLLVETIIKTWRKSIFKDEIYSCYSKHQLFQFFSEILRSFKVEETFPYSGNAFFNKSFIRLVETNFLSSGNCFFISAIFLLVEAIIKVMGETVLKERAYYCLWTTDFLASGNHFFLWFSETPVSDSSFLSSGNDVSKMASTIRKKSCKQKNTVSNKQKFSFHRPAWRIRLKKYVFITPKDCFHWLEYIYKKWLHLSFNNGFY